MLKILCPRENTRRSDTFRRFSSIGLAAAALCLASLSVSSGEPLSEETLEQFSAEYFERVAWTTAKQAKLAERDRRAMRAAVMPAPKTATGKVTDRWGAPIQGAKVIVEQESKSIVLGEGATDDEGRFAIPLKSTSYRGLVLTVKHDRKEDPLARWAVGGIYGGIVEYYVQLDREVDRAFLTALEAEDDETARLRLLLEMVGERHNSLDDADLFPFLGRLRPDLKRIIDSGKFDRADNRVSPSQRCRELLAVWCDPRDRELVEAWKHSRIPSQDYAAATIDEVCCKYADVYWGDKKPEERTMNLFNPPIVDPTKTHAMVNYFIRYAHWGYEDRLILVKEDGLWRLKMTYEFLHMTF